MFEVVFAYSRTTPQSARTVVRPDSRVTVETEAEALAALRNPPKGAKVGMVRQLAPTFRFVTRKFF